MAAQTAFTIHTDCYVDWLISRPRTSCILHECVTVFGHHKFIPTSTPIMWLAVKQSPCLRNMTSTTKRFSRVSIVRASFAVFGKGVQLISGSPYAETEPNLAKLSKLDLGGRGKDYVYP